MGFYSKKVCAIDCLSECCYFPKPGLPIEETEIKKFRKIVKNNLSDFHPEYRNFIKEIVESNEFIAIDKFGTKYIKCDTKKPGFDSCMVPYYPCIFLANAEEFTNKNKPCMIYPHRFSICKNTTTEDCLPGLEL